MAALDTSYFCSQVMLLAFMGYIVHMVGSAAMFLVTSAILSAISCYFINYIVYEESDMPVNPATFVKGTKNPTIVINNNPGEVV